MWQVGDRVEKYTGDYQLEGEVRSVLTTKKGNIRYVVEHDNGILHIYSEQNLRAVPEGKKSELDRALEVIATHGDAKARDWLYHNYPKFKPLVAGEMSARNTPLGLEIAIHYAYSAEDFPRKRAPACQEVIERMVKEGLLARSNGHREFEPTEDLFKYVNRLCGVPWRSWDQKRPGETDEDLIRRVCGDPTKGSSLSITVE